MTFRHPTIAEIDLNAFRHNLRQVRQRVGPHRAVLAVVKANAYGHGMIPMARAALAEGVEGLGVAFVEEGIELRQAGIQATILVMAGFLPEQAKALLEHRLTPVVSQSDQLQSLKPFIPKAARAIPIHLKLDTGMGRLGLIEGDVMEFIEQARSIEGCEIQGLMSHFADDDLANQRLAEEQIERFEKIRRTIEAKGIKIPLLHMSSSGAILTLERAWFNMVRPGIMLYGYAPSTGTATVMPLQPVMTLKTRIIHVKRVPAGASVSYGRTFITRRESRIAVLPIGYADGYSRAWSNCGRVLIGGRVAPVVGRVCMDMTMVDVTDLPPVKTGEEVVLIGSQRSETLRADELALQLGTIPYEILCAVSQRVPRIYRSETTP